jgi:hypothetical protein
MFVMMNAARLHVGLQGIGLLEAAWQKADDYSKERRQMRAPGPRKSTEAADPIAQHPAIRRILGTQRAWIDGGRVLAYRTAIELDLAKHHSDETRRTQAQLWCSLVTPVLKSAWTAQAFQGSSECLQVFGGHGFVREWGIEQIVRDSRVTMIYEGTNEIQAIDLLVRKVIPDGGTGLAALLQSLNDDSANSDLGAQLSAQATQLNQVTRRLVETAQTTPELPFWVADDYLRAVSLTLMTWAWLKIGFALKENANDRQSNRWTEPADALKMWVLPEFDMRLSIIKARLEAHPKLKTDVL